MFQIRFGKKHFPTLLLAQNTGLWEKVDTWFFSAEERAEVVTEQKKSQSITCPCIITWAAWIYCTQTCQKTTAVSAGFLDIFFPKGRYKHQGVLMHTVQGQ